MSEGERRRLKNSQESKQRSDSGNTKHYWDREDKAEDLRNEHVHHKQKHHDSGSSSEGNHSEVREHNACSAKHNQKHHDFEISSEKNHSEVRKHNAHSSKHKDIIRSRDHGHRAQDRHEVHDEKYRHDGKQEERNRKRDATSPRNRNGNDCQSKYIYGCSAKRKHTDMDVLDYKRRREDQDLDYRDRNHTRSSSNDSRNDMRRDSQKIHQKLSESCESDSS